MRKILKLIQILCCIVFISFVGLSQSWATTIGFSPSSSSILVGDSIDVDIIISGLVSDDLYDFDFNVDFDETIIAFDDYILGTGLGVNVSTDFFSTTADAYDGSQYGGNGVLNLFEQSWMIDLSSQADSFTLATLSFTGLATGTSHFLISPPSLFASVPILSGELGQIQNVSINSGSINVTAPVPEPATMVLFGVGLVGLAGVGRKKIIA